MAKNPKSAKVNIPMCIAGVLFYLTLLSIHLTSGLYARYTTATSGSDSSRVARFEVTEDKSYFSEELVLPLTPGTFETPIEVSNQSEVTVHYTITIENVTQNIPLKFQVNDSSVSPNAFSESFEMAPDSEQMYAMKIIWEQEGALEYMGMVDLIRITLSAEQMD